MRKQEKSSGNARPPVSFGMLLLYNSIFLVVFLFYSPFAMWKLIRAKSLFRGLNERLGAVKRMDGRTVIWIHGVSVGEVKAAQPIVRALCKEFPQLSVVVSSTTPTGRAEAQRLYPDAQVIYYPLDFGPFPGRALDRIRPVCILLMELELWPNFLNAAERRSCPVAVVNGRISMRSFKGYKLVYRLLPQLDRIDLFCVQVSTYAERLRDLGVPENKIFTTGNLKYDAIDVHEAGVSPDPDLVHLLGIDKDELVLVAGSTHHDEEYRIARLMLSLEKRLGRQLRLVVAPRHANERGFAVSEDLRRAIRGEGLVKKHQVTMLTEQRKLGKPVHGRPWVVVDTIGELERVYSFATAVFVGGSLIPHGGQNMLEPVALGKPTLFGPHVSNFQADVDLLLAGRGVIQVATEGELEDKLFWLFSNPEEARELVRRAQRVLLANQGATERTQTAVLALLRERAPILFDAGETALGRELSS